MVTCIVIFVGLLLVAIGLWTLFQALSRVAFPTVANIWSGIYSGLAFIRGIIFSFLNWVPWPVYLAITVAVVILLYSLIWCIQRKFEGEEGFGNTPSTSKGVRTFVAITIIGTLIGAFLSWNEKSQLETILKTAGSFFISFGVGAFSLVVIDAYMRVRDRFGEDKSTVEEKPPEEKSKESEESKLECEKVL